MKGYADATQVGLQQNLLSAGTCCVVCAPSNPARMSASDLCAGPVLVSHSFCWCDMDCHLWWLQVQQCHYDGGRWGGHCGCTPGALFLLSPGFSKFQGLRDGGCPRRCQDCAVDFLPGWMTEIKGCTNRLLDNGVHCCIVLRPTLGEQLFSSTKLTNQTTKSCNQSIVFNESNPRRLIATF